MRKIKNVVRKSVYQRIMDEVYTPLYKRGWMDVPDMENVRVLSYKITLFVIFSIASINSLVLILFLILLMCPFPSKIK